MKLTRDFYMQSDVVAAARALLGKVLYTGIGGKVTAGIIVETEAYAGITDRASHAWGGRRTARTEVMYRAGGAAYVYLCYGIHHLFNVVTNAEDIPHAVLIRSVVPFEGTEHMLRRRKRNADFRGPGKVSQGLGIDCIHTGLSLLGNTIWIEDRGIVTEPARIHVTPRIGVDYAGPDASLPYRFIITQFLPAIP